MSRRLSVQLGEVISLPVASHPLYAAIEAELRPGTAGTGRSAPWLGAAFGAALLLPGIAGAATITVNDTGAAVADDGVCTMAEAVANANTNTAAFATAGECLTGTAGLDQIRFDPGLTYPATINVGAEFLIPAGEDLDISGPSTPDQLIFDGGDSTRFIGSYADITLANLTAQNFDDIGVGSVVAASPSTGTVTVNNSRIQDNNARYVGGAISAHTVVADDSDFERNFADIAGGAIMANEVTLTNSRFQSNGITPNPYAGPPQYFRTQMGGAVFAKYTANISDSSFTANHAVTGGALVIGDGGPSRPQGPGKHWAARAKATLAPGPTQGINLSVVDSAFDQNQAIGYNDQAIGGAILAQPTAFGALANQISLSGSTLSNNRALPYAPSGSPQPYGGIGGGLAVMVQSGSPGTWTTTVDIDDTQITDNLSLLGGGALVMASTVTIDDSAISRNAAMVGGGTVLFPSNKYGGPSTFTNTTALTNTTLDSNQAQGIAGLLAVGDSVQGSGLHLTNNITSIHPDLAAFVSGNPPPRAGGKQDLGASTCADGKYGGGGILVSTSLTSLSGGSVVSNNCGNMGLGGVGLTSGKYPGSNGNVVVSPDTVVSNNTSYGSIAGMMVAVGATQSSAPYTANNSSASVAGTFDNNRLLANIGGSGGALVVQAVRGSTANVDQASITNNHADNGGAIAIYSSATSNSGTVTISNSTLSGNTAVQGAGMSIAPISIYSSPPRPASSFSVMLADKPELQARIERFRALWFGGRRTQGKTTLGSPPVNPVTVNIVNSTIDGNSTVAAGASGLTEQAGGIFAIDAAALNIDHLTLTGNSTGGGGGGLMPNTVPTTISNSIIAGNTATGTGPDINGAVNIDYSLVQDASGATLTGANNINVDPMLDALTNNGGATQTRLPQFGSPVVDAGDPAFDITGLPNDQRGSGFPRAAGGGTDMGAVEGITPVNVVGLAVSPNPVAEGSNATLTATLDAATSVDVMVTVAFSGTAVLITDFSSGDDDPIAPGVQIQILAGATTGDVNLAASADALDEPDEPFVVDVTAADFALVPSPVIFNALITDQDTPLFSIADAAGAENVGNLDFTVSLSVPSTAALSVDATTVAGSALAGSDFTATSATLNFAPGVTAQTFSVPILDDAVAEPVETFSVNLSNPVGAGVADGTANGTINDNEAAPTASLSLTPAENDEGGGDFTITATLSGPSSGDVVVTLNFGGTATMGDDFTVTDQDPGTPGVQIIIPAGSISSSVVVTPLSDATEEPNETIIVSIASASGANAGGSPGVGNIINVVNAPAAIQGPAVIPTLNEWMLLLLGLLLPATVMVKLRGGRKDRVKA